jgi:biotin operon repressor
MSEILETLFGSKAKTRILRFFLLNSEKEYSAQDIANKNMLAISSVRKEINELKKIKFLVEKVKKGSKYYALDQEFCFYSELKSLFAKSTASPESKSLSKLKNIGDVKLALVSGIFLNYPKSKVDMVLVANNVSRGKLKSVMNSLEAEIGKEVSFVLMNSDEFKYRLDMLDRFLLDFMEGTHLELIDKIPGLKRFILGRKKY